MADFLMRALVLVAAAGVVASLVPRWSRGVVTPARLVLVSLASYMFLGITLVLVRIGGSAWFWAVGVAVLGGTSAVAWFVGRTARPLLTLVLVTSCLVVVGVVWELRMVAADAGSLRQASLHLAAGASAFAAVVVLVMSGLLDRLPSWVLSVSGLLMIGLPMLSGGSTNGARIGFAVPVVGDVQPGELGRVLLLVWLARAVSLRRPSLAFPGSFRRQAVLLGTVTLPILAGLFVGAISNDFGPALVLAVATLAVVAVGGLRQRYVLWVVVAGAASVGVLVAFSDKIAERLAVLQDPLSTAEQGGLTQIGLGLAAMAHGPTGLGMGVVSSVPQWRNDMLLAVLAHEMGMSHLVAVLLVMAAMSVAVVRLVKSLEWDRHQLSVVGLSSAIMGQTLLMLGAMLAVLPLTGMPVPFVSMSGSSIVASGVVLGVVVGMGSGQQTTAAGRPGISIVTRTVVWSMVVLVACTALIVRVAGWALGADGTIAAIDGRDPIGTRLSQVYSPTIVTVDGVTIASTAAVDGSSKIRPANAQRVVADDMYEVVLGSSWRPGLSSAAADEVGCGGPDCPVVATTLDSQIQKVAWDAMQGKTGAVIAVDVDTGGILAYVSVEEGRTVDERDRVRLERTTPGSVAKILTGVLAVEEGVDTEIPASSVYVHAGGGTINSLNGRACGGDLGSALAVSCNPYFAQLAESIPGRDFLDMTGQWLNNQDSLDGLRIATSQLVQEGDLDGFTAMGGIGMGNAQVTPLAMAAVTAQVANNGEPVCLRLLEGTTDCDEQTSMTRDAATAIGQAMRSVVTEGTARGVSGLQEVDAAAKTGTADYSANLANATFTAYAPFSNPRVAVTVFVEPGPSEQGGLVGSVDAGPVAAAVLAAALG